MNAVAAQAIGFLMAIGLAGYVLVDTTLGSPPVVYLTAAVDEVGPVPNKKQEAACAGVAAGPGGTTLGLIRRVAGTVLSDPLYGAVGTGRPNLELARGKLNLAVALPGQDLPLLVYGIPDRRTEVGDAIQFCGAFAEETFLWPLVGYQERTWSFFGGQRGGPEYGPPLATRYRRVLWVADIAAP